MAKIWKRHSPPATGVDSHAATPSSSRDKRKLEKGRRQHNNHSSNDERVWEDVHFKRRRRSPEHTNPAEKRPSPPATAPRQGLPPYIKTPEGVIEVCGQCLRPGHMAAECRRAMTCQVCGGVGHRRRNCRQKGQTSRRPPETGREGRNWERHNHDHEHRRPSPRRQEHPPRPMEDERAPPPASVQTMTHAAATATRKVAEHHTSLALDGRMMRGKEELKSFTVVTITKINGGFVIDSKFSAALKEALEMEWDWPVKELRDGRMMISCRSPEEAREL
ncbi:hypothetical protein J5N97_019230 [Dioscorea zingiberensis]|uniref:CCHC-type domain-containing protein n=1 Tax=Dioscorea zingiberensis TaxID=325984 RepID=A0A9D5CDH7_9LILI|nr:hypothetical protein J5N97_019230 [Dioscorea zingiberensis]